MKRDLGHLRALQVKVTIIDVVWPVIEAVRIDEGFLKVAILCIG